LRAALRREYGWGDDVVVVGYTGKLIGRKGAEDLVDAVAMLQREGLPVALMLIGEGRNRPMLETRIREHGMKWTAFTGFKNQSELAACYTCLDMFVLPSRFDSWGLVLNEAMVFGLPVIATTMVGAALDLIELGQNGYVYDAGDVRGLASAIGELVRSPERRRQFGERSEAIVRRYSYEVCLAGIVEGLEHVVKRHPQVR
jgi:glycosyltransferase involved in cell wall biosynthesis